MTSRSEPIVEIIWRDAWFDSETSRPEDWDEECLCATVGYLVRETDEVISLAMERDAHGSGEYRWVLHIPKPMILQRKEIRA